jgi:hypothetical protein
MDLSCKRHWEETNNKDQINFAENWSIWIGNKKLSSNLTKQIQQHCSILRADRYWQNKLGEQAKQVDWEGTGAGQ